MSILPSLLISPNATAPGPLHKALNGSSDLSNVRGRGCIEARSKPEPVLRNIFGSQLAPPLTTTSSKPSLLRSYAFTPKVSTYVSAGNAVGCRTNPDP